MKLLQQILFAAIFAVCLTLTVSAQRNQEEKKEKPPKERVEIKPEQKPPRNNENNNNNRGNENRPKKPQAYFLISQNRIEITSI